jgi:hypothetical protein
MTLDRPSHACSASFESSFISAHSIERADSAIESKSGLRWRPATRISFLSMMPNPSREAEHPYKCCSDQKISPKTQTLPDPEPCPLFSPSQFGHCVYKLLYTMMGLGSVPPGVIPFQGC